MGDASFASILHLCQTTSLSIFWQILILCVCVGGGVRKSILFTVGVLAQR